MSDYPLRDLWVKALRLGEYPQTKEVLRDRRGYCCLGVLADLTGCNWHNDETDFYEAPWRDEVSADTNLPVDVLWDVGLETFDEEQLVSMNDNGKTFEEIADFIENELT